MGIVFGAIRVRMCLMSPLEVGRSVIDEVDNFGVEIIGRSGPPQKVQMVPPLEALAVDYVWQLVQRPLDVCRVRQVVFRSDLKFNKNTRNECATYP